MHDTAFSLWLPTVVVVVGWIISHWLSARREREGKRREQRIAYLLDSFRALSRANHHPRLYEIADDLEQAITDIQVLGKPAQVELAKELAIQLAANGAANLDPLLIALRDDLRNELGREPYQGRLVWLRVGKRGASTPLDSSPDR